jgi:putative hydrolase of the HAD superfamily
LKTGLVSNAGITTSPTLRVMLTHYGLLAHLDALIFSDELCLAKPSLGMFTSALDALEVAGEDAVFVGDSARHDVIGARAAGMRTVQIGGRVVEGIEPDARVTSLPELLDVLSGFDPGLALLNRAGA